MVTGSFEQSVFHHGEDRPELPPVEEIGSTSWYQQLKVPIVACTFAVREATALEFRTDASQHPVFGVDWVEERSCLDFDHGAVVVSCERPNLEIEASDRVVAHVRLRRWRIGGIETSSEWQDD